MSVSPLSATRVSAMTPLARVGWFRALGRYYKDPTASVLGKLVAFVAIAYAIMPLDLIPDVPIVGWLDDLGVLGLASMWLRHAVSEYRVESRIPPG